MPCKGKKRKESKKNRSNHRPLFNFISCGAFHFIFCNQQQGTALRLEKQRKDHARHRKHHIPAVPDGGIYRQCGKKNHDTQCSQAGKQQSCLFQFPPLPAKNIVFSPIYRNPPNSPCFGVRPLFQNIIGNIFFPHGTDKATKCL